MRIIIAGASGLIGRALTDYLTEHGHFICGLTRHPEKMRRKFPETEQRIWRAWRGEDIDDWQDELDQSDVLINLMGESILGGRWTRKRKERLYSSRVDSGKIIAKALARHRPTLKVFIQASAIGYYDTMQPQPVDEQGRVGETFLARLTRDWEQASEEAAQAGIAVYHLRLGMVLARESLVVRLMRPVFWMFQGGPVGSGRQVVSWIHIDDVTAIVDYLITRPGDAAAVNVTAPGSVTMDEFAKAFGRAMGRPSWLKVPAFVLRTLLGEMADETMLSGIAVYPARLEHMGFRFRYPQIGETFSEIISGKKK